MDNKYLLEEKANINLTFDDIGICILYIICYHIDNKHKYPFLQFMMDKIPYCNNIVKEQFTFPYIFMRNKETDIKDAVFTRVKNGLDLIGCDYDITEDMFKGIIFGKDCSTPYALVNISSVNILGLNLARQTSCWFVLPSEIINTKKVCNIDIDSDVTNLFTNIPQLSLLTNPKTNNTYMLPDVVYTGSELKQSEFQSIFGNTKKKIYANCSEYYFFYRSFCDAVKDGGWLKNGNTNKIGDRLIVENNSNKYVTGSINRYAVFMEGKLYLETEKEFVLTDDIIETLYPEPCIIICYLKEHDINPDLLVKKYENFVSLSFHKLNDDLLDTCYKEVNKKQYMIA